MTTAVSDIFRVLKNLRLLCIFTDFSTPEMVDIRVLVLRNRYYNSNPMLKKETFTEEDEVEIEKFLKRTKHPILLKFKKEFDPNSDSPQAKWQIVKRSESLMTNTFERFAFSTPFE